MYPKVQISSIDGRAGLHSCLSVLLRLLDFEIADTDKACIMLKVHKLQFRWRIWQEYKQRHGLVEKLVHERFAGNVDRRWTQGL